MFRETFNPQTGINWNSATHCPISGRRLDYIPTAEVALATAEAHRLLDDVDTLLAAGYGDAARAKVKEAQVAQLNARLENTGLHGDALCNELLGDLVVRVLLAERASGLYDNDEHRRIKGVA